MKLGLLKVITMTLIYMLIIVAENKPFQFSIASPKLSDTNTTVFSVTYQYERN